MPAIERFRLLREHYQTDLLRLDGIIEAGGLFLYYADGPCPLCEAKSNEPHLRGCGGDVARDILDAQAEALKIRRLINELDQLMKDIETCPQFKALREGD